MNMILNTDSYKLSQYVQYPPGTTNVFSYIEARDAKQDVLWFGLQAFIKEYMTKPITEDDIVEARVLANLHGEPFNEEGWRYILDVHKGVLPVVIRSVPEGTVVAGSNVLASIETTDPKCFWLVSYLETALLRATWYTSTVASNSFYLKRVIKKYMDATADYDPIELQFKLHDFGARGVSSQESAMLGGMAHLVSFWGTDTIAGILGASKWYDADVSGFSIPASEHSTITTWGKEFEVDAFENMLNQFSGENKIVACVSDSWDIDNAVENLWGGALADRVRNTGGTLVVRPDSGDPMVVPITVVQKLMDKFGYTVNSRGYKVLPPYLRVIQGDGITRNTLPGILANMEHHKLSATNIAFGMGAGMLQKVDRDTYDFAMKCSAVKIGNEWRDVWKEAPGKPSKRGRITLVQDRVTRNFRTVRMNEEWDYDETEVMNIVYRNGPIKTQYRTFDRIRADAAQYL